MMEVEEGTVNISMHPVDDPSHNVANQELDGGDVEILRLRVKTFLELIVVRLLSFLLIIVDIIIVIIGLSLPSDTPNYLQIETAIDYISLSIGCIFVVEICLRIFAKTPKVFFSRRQWFHIVDLSVIVVSFITTIVVVALSVDEQATGRRVSAQYLKLVIAGRLLRALSILRVFTEKQNVQVGARLAVGQNKRRWREGSFDLDLCYITDRVIAMSFPSSGKMAFYRNPIGEVARFLNTKHRGHYKVYNLCSEKTYDTQPFEGHVMRFCIMDHNVPSLKEMIEFCEDVDEWMKSSEDNVIAVHCKGGKGRTGTMISAWLLHSGNNSAKGCLDTFCNMRTDFTKSSKVQGVETPSQMRYVEYYEQIRSHFEGQLPPTKQLKLRNIIIHSIKGVGSGDGKDLRLQILMKGEQVYEANMFTGHNCVVTHKPSDNLVDIMLYDVPLLEDDVRVLFHSRLHSMPRYYENCLMYFWFHTAFVEESKLILPRNDIDNLHKPKVWNLFLEDFQIELIFDEV